VLKKIEGNPYVPKIKKITKKANASHRKRACATKIHGCRTPFPTRTSVVFAPAGSNPPHLTENTSTHLSRHASSSVMATAFTNQYSENLFGKTNNSLPPNLSTRLFNIIFIHSAKQNDSFNPQLSQLFPVDFVDFAD
jgi:hypothetical protein